MLSMLALIFTVGFSQASPPARAAQTDAARAAQVHVGRGYELEKDERFAGAAEEFAAALAIAPHLDRIRYQLGVCYFALGRDQDARRQFERLRGGNRTDPSVVYFLGRLDLAEHDSEAAIREFLKIVHEPPFPDTAYYLGSAYLEKGDLTASEKWLRVSEPLNPRDFRIPDHLARVCQRQGRTADAEKAYARAARLRQNYNSAAVEALACSKSLETSAADASRSECEKLYQPDDPDRLTLLGMIYGQHGHYEDAAAPLQRAAVLDPGSYEIQHNLGLTFFRLKRYDEARVPLERAVSLRPDFFDSSALLGTALFLLKDDLGAYDALHHARELNPQDRDTAEMLFRVASALAANHFQSGDYLGSRRYLIEAENLKPEDVQVHLRLADLYAREGDSLQAEAERRLAAEHSPSRPSEPSPQR